MKIAIPIDYEIVCENSVDGELPVCYFENCDFFIIIVECE